MVLCWLKRLSKPESFGSVLPKRNHFLKKLQPSSRNNTFQVRVNWYRYFLDEYGIVRAGGRIERANIPFCSRHPIVLSPDHELTRLIVMNCHERLKHEGVDHVRNELRQWYWILRCRTTVRKILHQCSYCRRRKAKPVPPMMASLPYDRLQIAPAFSKVGVDFLGPLKGEASKEQEKRYGCLFTCMVTRAVHLEVAFSLSTDSFIVS